MQICQAQIMCGSYLAKTPQFKATFNGKQANKSIVDLPQDLLVNDVEIGLLIWGVILLG